MKKPVDDKRRKELIAGLRRDVALRHQAYRDRALKLLPHLCARCGREFSGKRLRELTVHHKDNDHTNNPPDGSNWELLCLYCHDNEHEKMMLTGSSGLDGESTAPSVFKPFENLDSILKKQTGEDKGSGRDTS